MARCTRASTSSGKCCSLPGQGAMTANSFQLTGYLACHMYLPECNTETDPGECQLSDVPWQISCPSHERKTMWQFCEIIP